LRESRSYQRWQQLVGDPISRLRIERDPATPIEQKQCICIGSYRASLPE
jgi:hypothetical protein